MIDLYCTQINKEQKEAENATVDGLQAYLSRQKSMSGDPARASLAAAAAAGVTTASDGRPIPDPRAPPPAVGGSGPGGPPGWQRRASGMASAPPPGTEPLGGLEVEASTPSKSAMGWRNFLGGRAKSTSSAVSPLPEVAS